MLVAPVVVRVPGLVLLLDPPTGRWCAVTRGFPGRWQVMGRG